MFRGNLLLRSTSGSQCFGPGSGGDERTFPAVDVVVWFTLRFILHQAEAGAGRHQFEFDAVRGGVTARAGAVAPEVPGV